MLFPHSHPPINTGIKAATCRADPDNRVSMPQLSDRSPNTLRLEPRPQVTAFDQDGPGPLSPSGPRHDNDHVAIKDIQILPTTDEILCTAPPYMPRKNLNEPHFLENGCERHVDTLFRHLRFDSTEIIRDSCYHAAQGLATPSPGPAKRIELQRDTPGGSRYFAYQDIRLEEINTDERKGMLIRLSYECPDFMRGKLMQSCGRLNEGMLCALVCLDDNSSELSVIFTEIALRQSTASMDSRGGSGRRAAVELSFPTSTFNHDILTVTRQAQGLGSPRMILVEFPKILYAGFYHCLHRLQQLRPSDVSFLDYIAPCLNGPALADSVAAAKKGVRKVVDCKPPIYSQAPGFTFNLGPISSQPASFTLAQVQDSPEGFARHMNVNTDLDVGQAVAFQQTLIRDFVFTQGPPGTGKSFLGIALARTLLASRVGRPSKPILVVCQTNHALDSFLAGLRDAGIENLIRIGSNSKEDWTKAINLREKSSKVRISKEQADEKNKVWRHKQALYLDLDSWCKGLNNERATQIIGWHTVDKYLGFHYPELRRQFTSAAGNKHTEAFTFEYWAGGGDLKNLSELQQELSLRLKEKATTRSPNAEATTDIEELLRKLALDAQIRSEAAGTESLWRKPLAEREKLLNLWHNSISREALAEDLANLHLDYIKASNRLRVLADTKDEPVCAQADIIGMTTTTSATRWNLLSMVQPETLICEEAGEVLEVHSICSLVPSLEHAIFIGDPLQLRPQVAEQNMALETPMGQHYRLDESMFERFMLPVDPCASVMPTSQLSVQRRMHPLIANITRLTYPKLVDHDSTFLHASVAGIDKRMFWLDHRVPESESMEEAKSHVNTYEVEMVAGLVQYLLTRNAYSLGDIAVLTPYNGQLAALVGALQKSCPVWLNPKDREALLDNGALPLEAEICNGQKDAVAMENLLRIATVDSFQGEEAKVVIFSTVRSGKGPGFLKTANRVNVACSRARDGFYIIGNSQTLQQVPIWSKIAGVFAQERHIGSSIRLCCDRHPDHYIDVSQPADFEKIQECRIPCSQKLKCMHSCFEPCHDTASHDRIPCRKPCNKILKCGHKCQKMCFEECGSCQFRTGVQALSNCGHQVAKTCGGEVPQCNVVVRKLSLPCNHVRQVRCFEKDEDLACQQRCSTTLPCNHPCSGTCKECFSAHRHPRCPKLCCKQMDCGHQCQSQCHGDTRCPDDCNQPCLLSCNHGKCQSLCKRPCDPCTKSSSRKDALMTSSGPILCSLDNTIDQPEKFEDVLDRLIDKIGRKLGYLAGAISFREHELRQGLHTFLGDIRPNPMAQNMNKRILTERGSELRGLMNEIVQFRDDTIEPIEQSVIAFAKHVDGTTEYNMSFHLRFDLLEYRAKAVLILDTLNVIRKLMSLDDPTHGVQRQAEVLRAAAIQDCFNCIEHCEASLARCPSSSPCMQVELTLQRVQFSHLIDLASSSSCATQKGIRSRLDTAAVQCRQYPNSAGAFLDIVGQYRKYVSSDDPASLPSITNARSRGVEKSWSQHEIGRLAACVNKHPYSSHTFSGCPECGLDMKLEEEVFKKTQEFLHEDAFLKAMNSKEAKKSSPQIGQK